MKKKGKFTRIPQNNKICSTIKEIHHKPQTANAVAPLICTRLTARGRRYVILWLTADFSLPNGQYASKDKNID